MERSCVSASSAPSAGGRPQIPVLATVTTSRCKRKSAGSRMAPLSRPFQSLLRLIPIFVMFVPLSTSFTSIRKPDFLPLTYYSSSIIKTLLPDKNKENLYLSVDGVQDPTKWRHRAIVTRRPPGPNYWPVVIWESYPPNFGRSGSDESGSNMNNAVNQTDPNDDEDDPNENLEGIKGFKKAVARFMDEPLVELVDCVLVLASSLFVAISTVNSLPLLFASGLTIVQDVVAAIFVIEFFARWFSSSAPRGRHFTQPLILVDVFVVLIPFLVTTTGTEWLPAWLTSSSSLINLRLLRILRLQRVLQDMKTFTRFEEGLGIPAGKVKAYQLQLARVVMSVFTLLSVSTGLIYTVEHKVNPQITDYFTSLYFGLVTLTTVGYGDITPVTWQGKLVVSMSILVGVLVIPAQGAALVDALLERQREKESIDASMIASSNIMDSFPDSTGLNGASSTTRPLSLDKDNSNGRLTLETAFLCPSCSACMHWSSARFCWQCGRGLPRAGSVIHERAKPDKSQTSSAGEVSVAVVTNGDLE